MAHMEIGLAGEAAVHPKTRTMTAAYLRFELGVESELLIRIPYGPIRTMML